MPGIYDITPTTFNRPNDRLPEDLEGQIFQKFADEYTGQTWFINHKLKSTNLLVEFWKDNDPYASWWLVDIIDYDNIQVHWNKPVHGRAVVYSVRDFVGVSMVYDQLSPSNEWVINHKFGTRDILIDVWIDDALTVPMTADATSLDTVTLTFDAPKSGKAVLMVIDPAASAYLVVDWDHISGKPATFPPSSMPSTTAETAENALLLGMKEPSYYLNIDDLGKSVAPLELDATSGKEVIPVQFLPARSNMLYRDSKNTFVAQQVYIDDELSPLRMQWVAAENRVVIATKFIVTKVRLLNPEENPAFPDKEILASSDHLIQVRAGPGITLKQLDNHTLEISNESAITRRFSLAALPPDTKWTINDAIFDVPGDCVLQLYETQLDLTPQTGFSDHVYGTPPLGEVFQVTGDDVMTLNGERLEVGVHAQADHFVYAEHYLNDGYADVICPTGANGIWLDQANGRYVLCTAAGPEYTFYGVDNTTAAVNPITVLPFADVPGPFCLGGSRLYAVRPDATGMLELVSTNFVDIPVVSWTVENSFITDAYPSSGAGVLVIKVTGTTLFILNMGMNTISAYDRIANVKLWEMAPTQTIKDICPWDDGYLSISLVGETSLWVSTSPANSGLMPTFSPSVDNLMGASRLFALGAPPYLLGGMGIMPDDKIWKADLSDSALRDIYKLGETTLWLKTPYRWTVSRLWSVIQSIAWKGMDLSGFDDARIGFYLGGAGTMPGTLYRWTGTGFDPFPTSDLPTLGQPLSIIDTMTLLGGQELSYALYFKRGMSKGLTPGYVDQNFECVYQSTGVAMIVPISGDGREGTIPVACGPGETVIHNNTTEVMRGLKLLAIPTA